MKEPKKSKLKLIPIELAHQMVKAYDKERREPATKKLRNELRDTEVEDSSSVWISREALEEFFKLNDADGLRLYFAIADDYPNFKLSRPEYKKKHTLVLVATKSTDPQNPTMENSIDCLKLPEKEAAKIPSSPSNGPVLLNISGDQAGMAADDLHMCPPPKPNDSGNLLPLDNY